MKPASSRVIPLSARISSVKSPWLQGVNVGDIHTIPVSHGEGRFVANEEVLKELFNNGQVFTQYVDNNSQITMESPFNPNGSMYAIEGILSSDGRILGKMGHSERQGTNRFKNIYGDKVELIKLTTWSKYKSTLGSSFHLGR